jgi:hypothetical protein
MSGTSDRPREPVSFPVPDASGAPTKVGGASWYGWRVADARADALQVDNRKLLDEIRTIDKERESLTERVWWLEDQNRLITMMSTGLQAIAAISGAILVYLVTSDPVNQGLTWVFAVLTLLLLIAGAGVHWLPVRRQRRLPKP